MGVTLNGISPNIIKEHDMDQQAMPAAPVPSGKRTSLWIILVVAILLLAAAAVFGVKIFLNRQEKGSSLLVQQAIREIKADLDQYIQTNGSLEGFDLVDDAEDAVKSREINAKWDFEVVPLTQADLDQLAAGGKTDVLPYRLILATANSEAGRLAGRMIWWEGDNKRYHGFGIDDLTEPAVEEEESAPSESAYVQKSRSTEAQTGIRAMSTAYNVYVQTNGTAEGYSVDQALRDARLGDATLKHWSFSVEGNPPRKFIAISTADSPSGAGKQVWYDKDDEKFHGYGVDNAALPKTPASTGAPAQPVSTVAVSPAIYTVGPYTDVCIRQTPSLSGKVLVTVNSGDRLQGLGERTVKNDTVTLKGLKYSGSWIKVSTASGVTGWIHSATLR